MGRSVALDELLRKFERNFFQLSSSERLLLGVKKTELFLQAFYEVLENMLFIILVNKSIEGDLTNDWKRMEDAVLLIVEQQWIKARRRTFRHEALLPMMPISPSSLMASIPIQKTYKTLSKDTLQELVKDMRELKIEMNELKKNKRAISLSVLEGLKRFFKICMYYDSSKYERKDCSNYNKDLKKINFFKECRVKFTPTW